MLNPDTLFERLVRRRDIGLLAMTMLMMALLLGVLEYVHLDRRFENDLRTGADIVGRTASATVVFDSPREATDTLKAFDAMPDVARAQLLRTDGSVLARYEREVRPSGWLQRHAGQTQVDVAVLANGQVVAKLQVTADRGGLWTTMIWMIGAVLAIMLLAVTFTHFVSRRLHAAVRDAEDRMSFLAHHDVLTGLFNRATFAQALEAAIERSQAEGSTAALLCLDIDNFKLVNDTHGHAAGDVALRSLADLMRKLVREGDPMARLGGDEFAVLIDGHNCELVATRVALSLLESFPQDIEGRKGNQLGLSIGIASIPRDAQTAADAMHCADVALYQAKRGGKGRHVVYSSELGASRRERMKLEQDLRAAIEAGDLQLAYQPIFDARGCICSVEALARWDHPVRGWIPPSEFIALAEESGLIVELGEACLARARRDIDDWRARGCETVPVALNVSAQQLRREEDRERFLARLTSLALGPRDVEFELTESVMFEDLHNPASILVRLQSMGFTLAIDDFGTGYSSLAYLRRMRCRKLKIDRAFVRGVHADKDNAMLVDSIVRVAHSMNMLVVAEGVESAAEQRCLADLGCDQFQGFGLSKPQFAEVIAALLDPQGEARPRGTMLTLV